jgi:subtilisin family serine protease
MNPLYPEASGRPLGEPRLEPPPHLLHRHGAAVLDPLVAAVLRGQPAVRPTVYLRSALIVQPAVVGMDGLRALEEVAAEGGVELNWDPGPARLRDAAASCPQPDDVEGLVIDYLRLLPAEGVRQAPPDAWNLLQAYRERVGLSGRLSEGVGLDHVLTSTAGPSAYGPAGPYTGASPMTPGHPTSSSYPVTAGHPFTNGPPQAVWSAPGDAAEFGRLGAGPRMPVTLLVPPPRRTTESSRRPVVALLDTGVGMHPWLDQDVVRSFSSVDELYDAVLDHGRTTGTSGLTDHLLGSLHAETGHGTFMAGLVRQVCPDADLLSVTLVGDDGLLTERVLTEALVLLAVRQARALSEGRDELVDVLVLSCGYYPEMADEPSYQPMFGAALRQLRQMGVTVVCAAGNDGTDRPMAPAILADEPDEEGMAPLLCVGALNPDNRSIALFSNDGPWVGYLRPGASAVSIMPVTYDGSMTPSATLGDLGGLRSSVDPDDFTGGFAAWSGTSFAAAVLAGEVAGALFSRYLDGDAVPMPPAAVARARTSVATLPRGR